jgi:hypothetical protein
MYVMHACYYILYDEIIYFEYIKPTLGCHGGGFTMVMMGFG